MIEKERMLSLVTAAQNGNENALNSLFNETYDDVYYFALKTLKNADLACDITQETFITVFKSINGLKDPAAYLSWTRRIAYRHCLQYFDKKQEVLVDEDEDGNTVFDTLADENTEFIPHEALDKEAFRKTILAIIDTLSAEQRSAVMLFYFDELSVTQIAEIQGVSDGTVKSRLNYARKAIKASVEDYEKKNNIKLHSFSLLPLLGWVFTADKLANPVPPAVADAVTFAAATSTAASTTATVTTAASTSTAATGATVGSAVAKAAIPLAVKIASIAAAAAIAIGGGVTAIVLSNDNNNTDDNDSQNHSSIIAVTDNVQPEKDKVPTVNPNQHIYESESLTPYNVQATFKKRFIKFLDPNANIFVTKINDNTVQLHYLDGTTPTNTPRSAAEFICLDKKIYFKDITGKYIFYDGTKEIVCSDFKGVPIYADSETLGEDFMIISMDEGKKLYLTTYVNGVKERDNEPLVVYDQKNNKFYDTIKNITFNSGDTYEIYVEVEGALLSRNNVFLWHLDTPSSFYSYAELENIDRVIACGYNYANTSALYSKVGDDANIYYDYSLYEKTTVPIQLPNGYKVSDIKKAIFAYTTVIMFNDGSVYSCRLTHDEDGISLTKNEELTNHGKLGRIKDIYASHFANTPCEIRVLMDDNVLYEVALNDENE